MATTRAILTPLSAEFPASNAPELTVINERPVLAFDAATNESCYWTIRRPQGITGALSLKIMVMMASATTGDTDWDVSVEAVTGGDATDLDATTSFDTVNSTDNTTVPGTAGYMQEISVTLTNHDSSADGDYFRIKLTRDAAADTASGDAYVLGAELQEA